MSCITEPVLKSLIVANSCLLSLPSIFSAKFSSPFHRFSIHSKPVKPLLACSYSSSSLPTLLLRGRKTQFPNLAAVFAAQRDEDNTTVLEQNELEIEDEEGEFGWENHENYGSGTEDWEVGSGEDAAVDAIGDAGEGSSDEEGLLAQDYREPSEEAKVFAGNLPYNVDSEALAGLFERAGTVEIAEVIYNRETEQSRGFGFVTMSTVEEAERAVEMFHRYEIDGRLLTVNKASPRGTRPERPPQRFGSANRLYVGNLPWDVENSDLEELFSGHGKVVDVRVVYDRQTGRSKGFGFVTMSTEAELNDAIANLDGENFGGRPIRVNVAEERPPRSF